MAIKKSLRVFISKAKWMTVGGKKFYSRSKLERDFALYLQHMKELGMISDWHYEPKTFWFDSIKRGRRSYKPDFLVCGIDSSRRWYETKGYLDSCSRTKMKRFLKYFPEEQLFIVFRIGKEILLTKENIKEIFKEKSYGEKEEKKQMGEPQESHE